MRFISPNTTTALTIWEPVQAMPATLLVPIVLPYLWWKKPEKPSTNLVCAENREYFSLPVWLFSDSTTSNMSQAWATKAHAALITFMRLTEWYK